MSNTPSNMLPLGTAAPEFRLFDTVSEKMLSLKDVKGETATVIMFICNHCPFVLHVNEQLIALTTDYKNYGVGFVAISSNDVENYPQDSPELMKELAEDLNYPFPYLYDETQEVATAYDAACTPDFYIFNSELKLVYRGQLDSSRPGNDKPINGKDIRNSLNAIIAGNEVEQNQIPSMGCNIKWKH